MAQHDDHLTQRQRRRQEEWQRRDQADLDKAVRAMLEARETRRYLWWLLSLGKAIGDNPFRSNAMLTAFGCGEQNVGQQIMAHLLDVAPEGFIRVLKESEDERKQRGLELDQLRDDDAAGRGYEPDFDPGNYRGT